VIMSYLKSSILERISWEIGLVSSNDSVFIGSVISYIIKK
jgi:hypothetical protein